MPGQAKAESGQATAESGQATAEVAAKPAQVPDELAHRRSEPGQVRAEASQTQHQVQAKPVQATSESSQATAEADQAQIRPSQATGQAAQLTANISQAAPMPTQARAESAQATAAPASGTLGSAQGLAQQPQGKLGPAVATAQQALATSKPAQATPESAQAVAEPAQGRVDSGQGFAEPETWDEMTQDDAQPQGKKRRNRKKKKKGFQASQAESHQEPEDEAQPLLPEAADLSQEHMAVAAQANARQHASTVDSELSLNSLSEAHVSDQQTQQITGAQQDQRPQQVGDHSLFSLQNKVIKIAPSPGTKSMSAGQQGHSNTLASIAEDREQHIGLGSSRTGTSTADKGNKLLQQSRFGLAARDDKAVDVNWAQQQEADLD